MATKENSFLGTLEYFRIPLTCLTLNLRQKRVNKEKRCLRSFICSLCEEILLLVLRNFMQNA